MRSWLLVRLGLLFIVDICVPLDTSFASSCLVILFPVRIEYIHLALYVVNLNHINVRLLLITNHAYLLCHCFKIHPFFAARF
jgi:hypothetical protein